MASLSDPSQGSGSAEIIEQISQIAGTQSIPALINTLGDLRPRSFSSAPTVGQVESTIASVANKASGREMGFWSIGNTITISGTASNTATSVIVPSSPTMYDGNSMFFQFYALAVTTPAVAAATTLVGLFEGSTLIAYLEQVSSPTAASVQHPGTGFYRFAPAAGLHTYTVKAWVTSTTGTPQVFADPQYPAFLRVTRA